MGFGFSREDKEDLVQECCLSIFRWLEKEEIGPGELKPAFLRKVARNKLNDELRKRYRLPDILSMIDDEGFERDLPSPVPDGERKARSGRLGETIVECLGKLIPSRRRAVWRWIQGDGYTAIGESSGWDELGAKARRRKAENLVQRGRAELRACVTGKGYGKGYRP